MLKVLILLVLLYNFHPQANPNESESLKVSETEEWGNLIQSFLLSTWSGILLV
jgi:hypothetical protein